jgi:hypothetical protein
LAQRKVGKVEILGQGVVLPTAGLCDRLAAPDAGGAVEVEEAPRPIAGRMLDHKVTIEEKGLDSGQQ